MRKNATYMRFEVTKDNAYWRAWVPFCCICGQQHNHGGGYVTTNHDLALGNRSPHCHCYATDAKFYDTIRKDYDLVFAGYVAPFDVYGSNHKDKRYFIPAVVSDNYFEIMNQTYIELTKGNVNRMELLTTGLTLFPKKPFG